MWQINSVVACGDATGPLACAVERHMNRESNRTDGRLNEIVLDIVTDREKENAIEETEENEE